MVECDLAVVGSALQRHGFRHVATDPAGVPCDLNRAMYLHASRTGALIG